MGRPEGVGVCAVVPGKGDGCLRDCLEAGAGGGGVKP